MKDIFRLMRVRHWVKNMLVIIPAFFARDIWKPETIRNLVIGFFCFSVVSSIVYIFNDLKDIEKDRKHALKCKRPFASGAVSVKTAYVMMAILTMIAVMLSCMLTCARPYIPAIWCVVYFVVNIAYSIKLKHVPIVDVAILASGFIIRILYGASVSGVIVSSWLCLTVMAFALYMGIGKRRNELCKTGGNLTRNVLKYYSIELLDRYMLIVATLGIVFYSLWAGMVISNRWAIWTVPLVLFILMKYEMVIKGDSFGDPVDVLLSDHMLACMVFLYAVLIYVFLYVLR